MYACLGMLLYMFLLVCLPLYLLACLCMLVFLRLIWTTTFDDHLCAYPCILIFLCLFSMFLFMLFWRCFCVVNAIDISILFCYVILPSTARFLICYIRLLLVDRFGWHFMKVYLDDVLVAINLFTYLLTHRNILTKGDTIRSGFSVKPEWHPG